jgi:hypothetical protein
MVICADGTMKNPGKSKAMTKRAYRRLGEIVKTFEVNYSVLEALPKLAIKLTCQTYFENAKFR